MPPRSSPFAVVLLRLAVAMLAAAPLAAPAAADVPAVRPASLHRGTLTLRACGTGRFCGRLTRPLDAGGGVAGQISVYFEFYPHTHRGASRGTLVATEGGPGYPATESRADYLALFGPLMGERDVLIMDNRGTGRSGAIDCRELQTAPRWTVQRVARCGESLGARAPLYGTPQAADDLAALIGALELGPVDLYGDSYGTYFGQVFASRHPRLLRSLVLDGAYPLTGPDYAWYPNYAPAMRAKFNLACARSAACALQAGTSLDRIAAALERLRAAPFDAQARDVDGVERRFRADASQLAIVLFGSAPALPGVREADAAARAFVAGDRQPLLRLMAETASAVDSRDPTADATRWSAGLAAAVLCQDPPQIFDLRLPLADRARARDRALEERRRTHPDSYAPFSIDEYRGMPLDYSFLDECVAWPVASPDHPPSTVGLNAGYPDVPVLVISGEFDDITPVADGAAAAAAFHRGSQVIIANSFHVNALPRARSPCAAHIVRHFIESLSAGDTACAAAVPAVRLVTAFARTADGLEPAEPRPGNAAPASELRAASAAVASVGDLLSRAPYNASGRGTGLRGGHYRLTRTAHGWHLQLDRIRWVADVAVSGTVDSPFRQGWVRADLVVVPAAGARGRLEVCWPLEPADAMATIAGVFGRVKLVAQSPAP